MAWPINGGELWDRFISISDKFAQGNTGREAVNRILAQNGGETEVFGNHATRGDPDRNAINIAE